MPLQEYNRMRNFGKTAEPPGQGASKKGASRFVIQKHAASRLHYDFRLEMQRTLKSWAVPKGVPHAKGEKRLAVQVEDHPVSYINFEGTIPKGQYGGGTVMVWDRGTFEPLSEHPAKELAGGKLHFVLHGQKLEGEWYLVRLKDGKDWLLIRGGGDLRPVTKKMDDTSAISGRSMAGISEGDEVWSAKRARREATKREATKRVHQAATIPFPTFIEPMKARTAEHPPAGDWRHEIKLDGFRTLAFKDCRSVRLLSRKEKDFGPRFPEIREAVEQLGVQDAIIDGEIVALDPNGRSSFQLLLSKRSGRQDLRNHLLPRVEWDSLRYPRYVISSLKDYHAQHILWAEAHDDGLVEVFAGASKTVIRDEGHHWQFRKNPNWSITGYSY